MRAVQNLRPLVARLAIPPSTRVSLADHDPRWTWTVRDKRRAKALLAEGIERMAAQQERLYAQNTHAILLIFQAMDAAGKDSTIKHVMSGVNPQGCQVFSFKAPSAEERDHDYLWRSVKALPERGRIGIHNRSYYEEVLVVRVHPELLEDRQLPARRRTKRIWQDRFREINAFERYLTDNGTVVLKYFLHVSKEEQRERFLERIERPEKNWKFSARDVDERDRWDDYMRAYEDMLSHTSTDSAPWFVVPADRKWFTRLAVAAIIDQTLEDLELRFPGASADQVRDIAECRVRLMNERRQTRQTRRRQ
jgi:PPK2 family polyphosphate:nucleotide phosphotransferase